MLINILRSAVAADVVVDAENEIGLLHYQMKIVRDQQNRALRLFSNLFKNLIKFDYSSDIHVLRRLVEHKQIGLFRQSAEE